MGRSYCVIHGRRTLSNDMSSSTVLGSAIVHFLHDGTGGPRCKVRRQTHAFADDNQLYVHCDFSNVLSSVNALGVLLTPGLPLEKHSTSVRAKCFNQLRQLQRLRRSLDRNSATILVHAFVTSRIDYGNSLFANSPKVWTDKLQRVMNAAARVISDLRQFLHDDLYWLDVHQRITFKLCLLVFKYIHGLAPLQLLIRFSRKRSVGTLIECEAHRGADGAENRDVKGVHGVGNGEGIPSPAD